MSLLALAWLSVPSPAQGASAADASQARPVEGHVYLGQVRPAQPAADALSLRLPDLEPHDSAPVQLPYEWSASSGDAEHLRWAQGANGLGVVQVEAISNPVDHDRPTGAAGDGRGRFLVRLHGQAPDAGWSLDTALGDQHIRNAQTVSDSYYYALPSETMFRGLSGRGSNGRTELTWSAGQTARLQGEANDAFETKEGFLAGVGFSRSFAGGWQVGAQSWLLGNDAELGDRQSVATGATYTPSKDQKLALRTLISDAKTLGVWLDNDHRLGPWRQRWGGYYLQPELYWADRSVDNDRQGVYWRTDLELDETTWSGGVDWEATDILDDPSRTGTRTASGFLGMQRELGARTRAGAELRGESSTDEAARAGGVERERTLELFLDRGLALGLGRLSAVWSQTHADEAERDLGIAWTQDWQGMLADELHTDIGITHRIDGPQQWLIPVTRIELTHELDRRVELNGSMCYAWSGYDYGCGGDASRASIGAEWWPRRRWRVSLDGVWRRDVRDEDEPQRQILMTLAFEARGGK